MFKKYILNWLALCLLALANIALAANVAPLKAQPKNIQLEYEVTRDGKPFAKVKESFTQDGKQYRIESITKGIGVYALFGERKLTSMGEVTAAGLKPLHFELQQGDNANKTLLTDFDWATNTLNMQVKSKVKTAVLEKSTQDLASYVYQFMFSPPVNEDVKVLLTTGKKLNQYNYKVAERGIALQAAEVDYKTTHLVGVESKDKKELWLAEAQYYLPVRYRLQDDNGAILEQTLTKLHVE